MMGTKRYQQPKMKVERRGRKTRYVSQWWEDGHHRSKVLGHGPEMSRQEAQRRHELNLERVNTGIEKPRFEPLTFRQFVEQVYLPKYRGTWKDPQPDKRLNN